ncbi:MFS transporter [Robbsia andropogonis]|uniref:MFS transporter n=1 Tax=Robbsia andropogonis TaxID=28092 RepID=UPI002A6A20ED|nr:MFS transporter [Robbsia andropogonis]
MGIVLDRFGTKKIAAVGIFIWSAATVFTGMASTFGSLLVSRLAMGGAESCSNPVGAKVIRQWIPSSDRGFVTTLFNSGSYAGPAICSVVLAYLVGIFGWRASFFIAGGFGVLWPVVWLVFFGDPENVSWLSSQERALINQGREPAKSTQKETEPAEPQGTFALLQSRTVWGLALTQGCSVYTQYLLLTWLPSYLQTSRHLSVMTTGMFAAIPYAVPVVLCIAARKLGDIYVKQGGGAPGKRRNAVALAMVVGSVILLLPFIEDLPLLLVVFALAFTGIASTTSRNFALLNDLVPSASDVGKAMALVVIGGNAFGLLAPIATGYVIERTGGYNWAFGIAGGLLLIGAAIILTMTHRPIEPLHTGCFRT